MGSKRSPMAMLKLKGIAIHPIGTIKLGYSFAGEFWPDAMFTVSVVGDVVKALHLED